MIAFIADYADGKIDVDGNEIIEADWFDVDNLPKCPTGKLSVAGRLIDWYRTEFG
jgi:NAD+ diphosphatase